MSMKRWPRRRYLPPRRRYLPPPGRQHRALFPFLLLLLLAAATITISLYLRSLATELAVSTAQDKVVATVNAIIKSRMGTAEVDYGDLVNLEKDENGEVCAVTTNVVAINKLSSDILMDVVDATKDHALEIGIPIGSLTGSALLLSRGPDIVVKIQILSSSFTGFRSDLSTIGINQTRHQILLELKEDITLIMPWHTVNTSVTTEIPVAETIIVGQVPQSYLNLGE